LNELDQSSQTGHIRAIVVLTDGQENNSRISIESLEAALVGDVIVYAIAYGADAEVQLLEHLTDAANGLTVYGSTGNIEQIYNTLSMYV